jgi:hypothetical protein
VSQKLGDVIEIHTLKLSGVIATEVWTAAVIEEVTETGYAVKALRGTFDGTNARMMVPKHEKGRMWR